MTSFEGIYWNSSTGSLDISGGNINVKDTIHFTDHNTSFNGTYNTLSNTPILGTRYKYNKNTDIAGVATGEIRFDATISSAKQFSINFTDLDSKSSESHYFIRFDNSIDTISSLKLKLKNICFNHDNTVGPKSISKQEIIEIFNNVLKLL